MGRRLQHAAAVLAAAGLLLALPASCLCLAMVAPAETAATADPHACCPDGAGPEDARVLAAACCVEHETPVLVAAELPAAAGFVALTPSGPALIADAGPLPGSPAAHGRPLTRSAPTILRI